MTEMTNDWFSEETATLGDRIAGGREAMGLSQKDLARKIGVKTATIEKWEDDISEPRANRIQMLSGVLGVSLSWLLTGRGEGPEAPQAQDEASAEVLVLLDDIRALQADMARDVQRLAQLEKTVRAKLRELV